MSDLHRAREQFAVAVPPEAGFGRDVREAALRVVKNAYGTKPRHTKSLDGSCRDDCIPCGLAALASCFPESAIAAHVAIHLRP
jgi:hypothetical protein